MAGSSAGPPRQVFRSADSSPPPGHIRTGPAGFFRVRQNVGLLNIKSGRMRADINEMNPHAGNIRADSFVAVTFSDSHLSILRGRLPRGLEQTCGFSEFLVSHGHATSVVLVAH